MPHTFCFAGLRSSPATTWLLHEHSGHLEVEFQILAAEIDEDQMTSDPIPVGTISIGRISHYVLTMTKGALSDAIDITSGTYGWASVVTDDEELRVWDKAFPEYGCASDMIYDYIGIERVFIDPRFRGHGFFKEALKGIAAILGFADYSAFVLVANPWAASQKSIEKNGIRAFKRDLKSLTNYYKSIGFRHLAMTNGCQILGFTGMHTNKQWDAIWLEDQSSDVLLDSFNSDELMITF